MRVRWIVTGVISAWNLSLKLLSSILDVWPLMSFICINLWHLCPRHSSLAAGVKFPGFFPWIAQQITQDTTLCVQLRHEEKFVCVLCNLLTPDR